MDEEADMNSRQHTVLITTAHNELFISPIVRGNSIPEWVVRITSYHPL